MAEERRRAAAQAEAERGCARTQRSYALATVVWSASWCIGCLVLPLVTNAGLGLRGDEDWVSLLLLTVLVATVVTVIYVIVRSAVSAGRASAGEQAGDESVGPEAEE